MHEISDELYTIMKVVLPLITILILLTGCQTKEKHKEFVKTITFSNLETVVLAKLAERGTNADDGSSMGINSILSMSSNFARVLNLDRDVSAINDDSGKRSFLREVLER